MKKLVDQIRYFNENPSELPECPALNKKITFNEINVESKKDQIIDFNHPDLVCNDSEVYLMRNELLESPLSSFLGPCTQIFDDIYLGAITDAINGSFLKKNEISAILNVAKDVPNVYSTSKAIDYLSIEVEDDDEEDIKKHFEKASEFIENHRNHSHNILIHCLCGISRSSSFLIAYLIKHQGYSLHSALKYLHSLRPIVRPNDGFIVQLSQWEQQHQETSSYQLTIDFLKNSDSIQLSEENVIVEYSRQYSLVNDMDNIDIDIVNKSESICSGKCNIS